MKTDAALTRLRAANPVPAPPALEDAALFERITAQPRKPAEGGHLRRPRLVVALALLGLLLLGGSALGISTWLGGRAVTPPVTRAEYRDAQRALALPPGYRWPAFHVDPNSMTTVGGGGGRAVLIAQNAWECYWAAAIRHGDSAAGRRAQAVLDDLTTRHAVIKPDAAPEDWVPAHPPAVPYAVYANDGGLQWIRQGYAQAAAGDPARISASCRANRPASG